MTLRSAIYLQGNKYKLFEDIRPHLEDDNRKVLVDLFGGSGCVSLNAAYDMDFDRIIYNDSAKWVYDLHKWLQTGNRVKEIAIVNDNYGREQSEFLRLKDDYNKTKDVKLLYLLMCRSNSNMVRFNSSGEFNMTWGDRKPFFPKRIEAHQNLVQGIELNNKDFGDIIEELLEAGDLTGTIVYLDPPYQFTQAIYQDQGGWTDNDNTSLLEYVLELYNKGAKIVMSNVFENRNKVHQELIDWCEEHKDKFDVHHLNIDYNNSSFRKGTGNTDEVLIVSKED